MRQRWFSGRAMLLHLALLIIFPGCLVAGWWQATRALSGNILSWAYTVEWPCFAVLAVVGWWQLIHDSVDAIRERRAARRAVRLVEVETEHHERHVEDEDEALRAYNDRLVAMAHAGKSKTWRNPRGV